MSLLSVDRLTVSFGGLRALDEFSFSLSEGDFVGLIGPNGSGKTTFFNALTGIYKPQFGSVSVDGNDVTKASPQAMYEVGVTRTFQRLRLVPSLSVFDNLIVGSQRGLNANLWWNIFKRAGLRKKVDEELSRCSDLLSQFNPRLVGTLLSPVSTLSMIDRRRIEVCRALISQPRILLLDEPSAGMTHEETRMLMEDLLTWKELSPSLAIVLIEHEMGVIDRVTNRCVVLNYGKKIAEGEYQIVSQDPLVKTAYLGEE